MKKLNVLSEYDILIERGLIARCGEMIRTVSAAKSAVIVTDSNVSPLYAQTVCGSLSDAGFNTSVYTFAAGEPNKNIDTVTGMLNFFAEKGLTRSDIIVALGGGVTGDLAGFAAAVYLRGIDFIQIPTTLLAQIDSSVGGKTGCDLPSGKNLCGAFYHPRMVIIDPDTLDTLPETYLRDGMGEAIKYGCANSADLFDRLEGQPAFSFTDELIAECVAIKAGIVERDFTEKGERMLLNFGHTIGHAIEKYQNFSGMSHGAAVGVGSVMITRAAEKAGLCKPDCADRIAALLKKYGLPCSADAPLHELCTAALADKKRRADSINLVLIHDIGDGFIHKIQCDELEEFLR